MAKLTKVQLKHRAQEELMRGIANALGYWEEELHRHPKGWLEWSEEERQEYRDIMKHEADRVAKLFGFDKAWVN